MKNTSFSRPLRMALLVLTGVLALAMLVFCSALVSQAKAPLSTTAVTIVSFQDGASPALTYAGTTDTYISGGNQSNTYGFVPELLVSGGVTPTVNNTLIAWDISAIPQLSTVQAVTITLYITETSTYSYSIYQMNKTWSESQANWTQAAQGVPWTTPGAGDATDRSLTALASFVPTSTVTTTVPTGIDIPFNVALVQSWVNTPSNNRGILIANRNNLDEAKFVSSDFRLAQYRPKLTIKYLPPTVTPTTPVPPITNFVGVVKSISPSSQIRGGFFTFRIDVTNTSTATLKNSTLVDSFPSVLTVTSVQPSTGTFSYNSGTRTVTVTFADIPKNTTAYVTILAQVNTTATTNTNQNNSAAFSWQIQGSTSTFQKTSNAVTYLVQGSSTLPPTGGIEAPPKASGVFVTSLVLCALLSLIGLSAILYSLVAGKRQTAWSEWFTRMGAILLVAAAAFGVLGWLSRPAPGAPAPEPLAQSAPQASPTASPAWILQEGGYEEMAVTPTPLTLPDYPIPTPKLESTPAPGEQGPDTSAVVQIEIPAIGVNTVVKYVPFDGNSWMIGGLRQEVAWMGETSWPGLGENTGFAGHVTLTDGSDGPFRKLGDLKAGDVVVLFTEQNIYTYRVRQQAVVEDIDMSVLDAGDKSSITLITCTNWSKDLKIYLQRLIVLADLEKVEPLQQARVNH
jgi:LPXTG-site transpeptidase (sortase) family protein